MSLMLTKGVRVVLGLTFLWAAFSKAHDQGPTARAIMSVFQVELSLPLGFLLVGGLAVVELALALWLLCGYRSKEAAASAFLLLIVFSIALGKLALDPSAPPCGCLGGGADTLPEEAQRANIVALFRNACLSIACIGCIIQASPVEAPEEGAVLSPAGPLV